MAAAWVAEAVDVVEGEEFGGGFGRRGIFLKNTELAACAKWLVSGSASGPTQQQQAGAGHGRESEIFSG